MIAQINNTVIKSILFCCNQLVNKFEKKNKFSTQTKFGFDFSYLEQNGTDLSTQKRVAFKLSRRESYKLIRN